MSGQGRRGLPEESMCVMLSLWLPGCPLSGGQVMSSYMRTQSTFISTGYSSGFAGPYPCAFYLHVDEQVEGRPERELARLLGLDAGIGERMLPVDREYKAVRKNFDGIDIVARRINGRRGAVRRLVLVSEDVGVLCVDGLIDLGVVVETLHDVDFAAVWPLSIGG